MTVLPTRGMRLISDRRPISNAAMNRSKYDRYWDKIHGAKDALKTKRF